MAKIIRQGQARKSGKASRGFRYCLITCDGPSWADKCQGRHFDPSADGHGGLNGGGWYTCSECSGRGRYWTWLSLNEIAKMETVDQSLINEES